MSDSTTRLDDDTARRRLDYLYEVTARLHEMPLDENARLLMLGRLAVPDIADWCLIDTLSETRLTRVTAVHWDPTRSLSEHTSEHRYDPDAQHGPSVAVRTRKTYVTGDIAARAPSEIGDAIDLELLSLGIKAYLSVPLEIRGVVVGVATFAFAESARRYDRADQDLAEDLGRRAAQAIENTRLYEQGQRALVARDDILAVVSHDLKNPLSVVGMAAGLIKGTLSKPDPKVEAIVPYVEAIERAAREMERLINMLLDAARIDAGLLQVQARDEHLHSIVGEVIESWRPTATGRKVELRDEVTCERSITIDREMIARVLNNLIGNAVKFAPKGGVVRVAATSDERGAQVSVSDNGPGIPAAQIPHLFDRFWQAPGQARKGSGLGLYIARAIVEAHGGTIRADSEPSRGATFTFNLPARSD